MEINISLSGNPQEIAEVTGLFKDMKAEVQKLNDRINNLKIDCQHIKLDNNFLHREYGNVRNQLNKTFSGKKDAASTNVETEETKPAKVKFEKETTVNKR